MEFITVEQFQEQPKEVQEVFLDWWQPSIGDLFSSDILIGMGVITSRKFDKDGYIPLFTEGQLRKFIEDKKGKIVEVNLFCGGYSVVTAYRKCEIYDLGKDLLQAYWKVACQIAREG